MARYVVTVDGSPIAAQFTAPPTVEDLDAFRAAVHAAILVTAEDPPGQ